MSSGHGWEYNSTQQGIFYYATDRELGHGHYHTGSAYVPQLDYHSNNNRGRDFTTGCVWKLSYYSDNASGIFMWEDDWYPSVPYRYNCSPC